MVNLRKFILVTAVLICLVSVRGFAEGSLAVSTQLLLLPTIPTVVNGVESTKGPAAYYYKVITKRKNSKGVEVEGLGSCTITPISPRVFLSDAHCLVDGIISKTIYLSPKLDPKEVGIPVDEFLPKGKPGKDIVNDLGVGILSADYVFPDFTPIESFATEAELKKILSEEAPIKANFYGYGIYQSVEQEDGKFKHTGVGTRRMGSVALSGMAKVVGDEIIADKEGPFIAATPFPNHVAPGDSGGPIAYKGKVLGLATAVRRLYPADGNETDDEKEKRAENYNYAWAHHMIFLPVHKHMVWVDDQVTMLQKKQDDAITKRFEKGIAEFYDFSEGISSKEFNDKVMASQQPNAEGGHSYPPYDRLRTAIAQHLGMNVSAAPRLSMQSSKEKPAELTLHLFDDKTEKPLVKLTVTKEEKGLRIDKIKEVARTGSTGSSGR